MKPISIEQIATVIRDVLDNQTATPAQRLSLAD
jgi:hypothetical protein